MPVVEIILVAVALVVAAPLAVLAAECLAALLPTRRLPLGVRPRCAVLVPAHNEEVGLPATLSELKPQLAPGDRILVVADNCTDRTAEVARTMGVEAAERTDAERRGKGYALAFGVERLAADPPNVVVVIDADCRVPIGSLDLLVRSVAATGRPTQAAYTLDPPPGADPRIQLSAYAFRFKNVVRPAGLDRLGQSCLLTGTGMAFPYTALRAVPLASGNIVEDMRLGVDLAVAGYPPRFLLAANVGSELPAGGRAAVVQRTRWEHGHMQTLLSQCPRLVWQAIRQRRPELFGMALELGVPPLSVLALGVITTIVAAVTSWLTGGSIIPLAIISSVTAIATVAMFAAWAKFGRATLPFATLFAVPAYILGKLPIYIAFLVRPQRTWVRTARTGDGGPKS